MSLPTVSNGISLLVVSGALTWDLNPGVTASQ